MDSKRYANHRQNKKGKKLLVVVLIVIAAMMAIAVFAVANIPIEVTILDGSTSKKVTTNLRDPEKIIEQNGISLGEHDVLDASQFEKENAVLIVKREMNIVFSEGGKDAWKVNLPARTVADVLTYLGKELGEKDVVEPAELTVIQSGDRITLYRAGKATMIVGGESSTIQTSNKTVKQLLNENDVTVGKDDIVTPALDTVLANGETLEVIRVSFKEETKTEKIKFKTVKEDDSSLGRGTEKVLKKGKEGEKEVTYRTRLENGKEVKTTVAAEKVVKKPVNKVVAVGTALSSAAIKKETKTEKKDKGFEYSKKIVGIATAYYEPPGNLTASGMKVGVGRIGVNPKVIPYGTKLYVTGYGYCVAADCGWGTIGMGRIADLYMNSEAECEAWGVRTVTMYVLK